MDISSSFREKVDTLITTRSSGSSYLNRAELQNGCFSLGHPSTFIPCTISGSYIDPETGTVNEKKLKQNLDLAIDAYICRVNGAPCGDTTIQLYKGCKDSDKLKCRQNLLIFLKGSRKAKAALKQKEPEQYAFFQSVWDVRTRHMVPNLPSQYIFMLLCCYRPDCCHPVCKHGPPTSPPKWYTGGPPITHLPLPVLDEQRLWGSECQSCHGTCSGHYKVVLTDITNQDAVRLAAPLPSTILKEEFSKSSHPISDDFIQVAAEKALLNQEDTRIWLEHLQTVVENRKCGAARAAATRNAKKARHAGQSGVSVVSTSDSTSCHCGKCGKEYMEETDKPELWIACDLCDHWYCGSCEQLTSPPENDTFFCDRCKQ